MHLIYMQIHLSESVTVLVFITPPYETKRQNQLIAVNMMKYYRTCKVLKCMILEVVSNILSECYWDKGPKYHKSLSHLSVRIQVFQV